MTAQPDVDLRCAHCSRLMWRKGTPPEHRPEGSVLLTGRGACCACYHRIYTAGGAERPRRDTAPKDKPKATPRPSAPPVDTTWHGRAACRNADETLFFHPENETGAARRQRAEDAKAVCRGCEVLEICREQPLARREQYGTWGAISQDERDVILGRDRNGNASRARKAAAA